MRRVVSYVHTSLDGYAADRDGAMDWLTADRDPAAEADIAQLAASAAGLLLGRKTYEQFAQAWPTTTGPLADAINGVPKYVLSRSGKAEALPWGDQGSAEQLVGPATETLPPLTGQDSGHLLLLGSPGLVLSLSVAGLIDEYRIHVHPVALGAGAGLFTGVDRLRLDLVDSRPYANGSILLVYRPASSSA